MSYFMYNSKKVFYKIKGKGEPLLFLHGNTTSSRMFGKVKNYFSKFFSVILIDFPGHGKSERLSNFPVDFWYENAQATIALINHLNIDKVNILGTSGGALVGLNVALERPDLVSKIVADNLEGEKSKNSDIEQLYEQREKKKKKLGSRYSGDQIMAVTGKK